MNSCDYALKTGKLSNYRGSASSGTVSLKLHLVYSFCFPIKGVLNFLGQSDNDYLPYYYLSSVSSLETLGYSRPVRELRRRRSYKRDVCITTDRVSPLVGPEPGFESSTSTRRIIATWDECCYVSVRFYSDPYQLIHLYRQMNWCLI